MWSNVRTGTGTGTENSNLLHPKESKVKWENSAPVVTVLGTQEDSQDSACPGSQSYTMK